MSERAIMDYYKIKEIAKKHKISASKLLALAPGNDPYYVGQPMQKQWAIWFSELWGRFGLGQGVHLRRIHYQLVSQDPPVLTPIDRVYENTDNCWNQLGNASKWARYLGLIPIDAFVDRRNPEPIINASFVENAYPEIDTCNYWDEEEYSLPQVPRLASLPHSLPAVPDFEVRGYEAIQQGFLIEIWAEKTTMNDVIEPLCQKYQVNLITGAGELSITAVSKDLLSRVNQAKRPARILYISDFDPAGIGMPISVARKIEFELAKQELEEKFDIKLQPIVLTSGQVLKYRLPRVPVKDSDKRKDNFQAAYGQGQVELDALEALYPGELAKIVESEILNYYDPSLRKRSLIVGSKLSQHLREHQENVLGNYLDELEELEEVYQNLVSNFQETQDEFDRLVKPFQEKINAFQSKLKGILREAESLNYKIFDDLKNVNVEVEEFAFPEPNLPEESDNLLFDSTRDYFTQLEAYVKQRKGQAA